VSSTWEERMTRATQHPALRKRVVIIFLGAVLLPSLILCYLGLQSIQQEKSRQEQIHRQNIESTLALTMSRIESDVEDRIRDLVRLVPPHNPSPDPDYFEQFRSVTQNSGLVEDIFLLDSDFQILYPRTFLKETTRRQTQDTVDNQYLDTGELFEIQGNVQEALAEYRRGLDIATSQLERLTLLMRIARCELKKGLLPEAVQSYRQVIDLDDGRFLGGEVPFILIAYHQAVNITARLESSRAALSVLLDYYELLIDNFHLLPESQYEFYLTRIKENIEDSIQAATAGQLERYNTIRRREAYTEKERVLHAFIASQLLPEYRNDFSIAQRSPDIRYIRSIVDTTSFVIVTKGYSGESRRSGLTGILLNEHELSEVLSSVVAGYNTSEDVSFSLITDDGITNQPDNAYIKSSDFSGLADLFPAYAIGISPGGDDSIDALFMRSLILYYILFVAIIGLIIFGIVFIFRDISREEELSRLKSEFISNVSHEIKTPIATIRTLAENLNEGWILHPAKQRSYFHNINREAERLSHLAENILDFSRIEARRKTYRKETVDPAELLQKVIRRFRVIHDSDDIKLDADIPQTIHNTEISPDGIEQAVLNLLDNAVKYSDGDKKIDIRLEQKNGEMIISVTDYGIGIPEQEQQKIFEKFYRGDSKNGKKAPGSGIGLSLVKEIADMHAGRIEVNSEPGKGSTFSLIIPINKSNTNEQNTAG